MSGLFYFKWEPLRYMDEKMGEPVESELLLYSHENMLESLDHAMSPCGAESKDILFRLRSLFLKKSVNPWASIFLDREYAIYHYGNTLREPPEDFFMSSYTVHVKGRDYSELSPRVSMFFFPTR